MLAMPNVSFKDGVFRTNDEFLIQALNSHNYNKNNMEDMIEIPNASYLEFFKKITGAFGVAECIALVNICKQVPEGGVYLELGTHKGKSTVASIYGLPNNGNYYLVEPEFKDEEWGISTGLSILAATKAANKSIGFSYEADYSTEVIPKHDGYSYVFVDSGVHDDLVMEEVKMLEDRMIPKGIIAFHDYGNQFTAVQRAYDYLLSTGKYESIGIDWQAIFKYVREHNLEDGNNSWHERGSEEFPKFVGAVKRR